MKLIPLVALRKMKNHGKYFAMVDDEDFDFLSQWHWGVTVGKCAVYASRKIIPTNRRSSMHREIMKHHGLLDESKMVDHRDKNGLNNQKANLRACTSSQNQRNRSAWGTSKYLGVSRGIIKLKKKDNATKIYWIAKLQSNGKRTHIGCFDSEIDAALAYNEAAKIHHGEFARLNIITP